MMSNFQNRNQRLRVHQVYTGKRKRSQIFIQLLDFQALQDWLAPWALKLLEIFRNCKKLNIN